MTLAQDTLIRGGDATLAKRTFRRLTTSLYVQYMHGSISRVLVETLNDWNVASDDRAASKNLGAANVASAQMTIARMIR